MRVACRVRWIDGDSSDCILLVNTVSYNNGSLRLYLVENEDYFYMIDMSSYEFQSFKRQLLECGFAYINKAFVSETLWEEESVVIQ